MAAVRASGRGSRQRRAAVDDALARLRRVLRERHQEVALLARPVGAELREGVRAAERQPERREQEERAEARAASRLRHGRAPLRPGRLPARDHSLSTSVVQEPSTQRSPAVAVRVKTAGRRRGPDRDRRVDPVGGGPGGPRTSSEDGETPSVAQAWRTSGAPESSWGEPSPNEKRKWESSPPGSASRPRRGAGAPRGRPDAAAAAGDSEAGPAPLRARARSSRRSGEQERAEQERWCPARDCGGAPCMRKADCNTGGSTVRAGRTPIRMQNQSFATSTIAGPRSRRAPG